MSLPSSHRLDTAKAELFGLLIQCTLAVQRTETTTTQTRKWLYGEYTWRALHTTFLSGRRTYSGYTAEMGHVRHPPTREIWGR